MTEKRLWKRVREAMRGVRGWHGTRIEAGVGEAISGTPDCVITAGGRTRWVELKCWPEPLNASQQVWATERDSTGADGVLVLAWVSDGMVLVPWSHYDRGNLTMGWSGKDVREAFESRIWKSIRAEK